MAANSLDVMDAARATEEVPMEVLKVVVELVGVEGRLVAVLPVSLVLLLSTSNNRLALLLIVSIVATP